MDCQDDLEWASLGGRPALAVEGKLVPLRLPSSASSSSKYISEWLWAVFINSWKVFPLFGITCPTRSEWWEFQLLPFGPPGECLIVHPVTVVMGWQCPEVDSPYWILDSLRKPNSKADEKISLLQRGHARRCVYSQQLCCARCFGFISSGQVT